MIGTWRVIHYYGVVHKGTLVARSGQWRTNGAVFVQKTSHPDCTTTWLYVDLWSYWKRHWSGCLTRPTVSHDLQNVNSRRCIKRWEIFQTFYQPVYSIEFFTHLNCSIWDQTCSIFGEWSHIPLTTTVNVLIKRIKTIVRMIGYDWLWMGLAKAASWEKHLFIYSLL